MERSTAAADPPVSTHLPAKRKVDDISGEGAAAGPSDAGRSPSPGGFQGSLSGNALDRVELPDNGECSMTPRSEAGPGWRQETEIASPSLGEGRASMQASPQRDAEQACSSRTRQEESQNSFHSQRVAARDHELQFFVRHFQNGKTLVMTAKPDDTVEAVLLKLRVRTGILCHEQRLLLAGRQLHDGASLAELGVQQNSTLQLVARMRSTGCPRVYQVVADIIENCKSLGLASPGAGQLIAQYQERVSQDIYKLLGYAADTLQCGRAGWEGEVAEYMETFRLGGGAKALVALLHSKEPSNSTFAEDCIKLFAHGSPRFSGGVNDFCGPLLVEFCSLLETTLPGHTLFDTCQAALVNLLDKLGDAHGTPHFKKPPQWVLTNLSPYLHKGASKLRRSLLEVSEIAAGVRAELQHPLEKRDAKTFTALAIPICKAMVDCPRNHSSGPALAPLDDEETCGIAGTSTSGAAPASRPATRRKHCLQNPPRPTAGAPSRAPEMVCDGDEEASKLQALLLGLLEVLNTCLEETRKLSLRLLLLNEMGRGPLEWAEREKRALALMPEPLRSILPVLLKGLHALSKVSTDSTKSFVTLLERHRATLNIIARVRLLHPEGELAWLLDYRHLLDFELKQRWVASLLSEPSSDHGDRLLIDVRRGPTLLAESLEQLVYVPAESLKEGLVLRFTDEEGAGVGVLREWFTLITKAMFNPANALFVAGGDDRKRFFPSAASSVNPGHLTYFKFCGRVMALALMHHVHLDATLAGACFKQLAGRSIDLDDVRDVDPTLHSSCKTILEMDPALVDQGALGLTFSWTVEELGRQRDVELCPGGDSLKVTSANRGRFVALLVQRRLSTSVQLQTRAIAEGFAEMLDQSVTMQEFLRPLEPEDFEKMLYGAERDISIEDWKLHTEYHGYHSCDQVVRWFWEVVEGMNAVQRRRLLFFATSISRLSPEGFAGLSSRFHIHNATVEARDRLPTAHTCFQQLLLPPYTSFETMSRNLHLVIADHVVESFGFV